MSNIITVILCPLQIVKLKDNLLIYNIFPIGFMFTYKSYLFLH